MITLDFFCHLKLIINYGYKSEGLFSMYSNYDKLIYINLTQDQITATIDELIIHDTPVTLVKIADGSDLKTMNDPKFFPGSITNRTKIYFSAHGREELTDCVLDRQSGEPKIYKLDDVAQYFRKLLVDPALKDPLIKPRLTLVLCVCEGLGFAKELQQKLLLEHRLYVDVIANKYVLHEQFEKPKGTNTLFLTHRETSEKGMGREHQRPHSKVLLTIDNTGSQKEIDAYELKWIKKVLTSLHAQIDSFSRWADFSKPENNNILKGIISFCNDIDTVINLYLQEDIHLTANYLLALLQSCSKAGADPLYKEAMKYEMFQLITRSLIKEGIKYINPSIEMQACLKALDESELREQRHSRDRVVHNLNRLYKADFSALLVEASENGIDSVMDQLLEKQAQLFQLNHPTGS